jgi:hypothetical protein
MGPRFSSGDQIEGMSGSPFVAMGNQWSATAEFDLNNQQQQNANQWLRGSGTQIRFTPRVSMAAAAYPAGATFQEEGVGQVNPMRSDLEHGVGLYEYYMRVTSGTTAKQGSVVNRFS